MSNLASAGKEAPANSVIEPGSRKTGSVGRWTLLCLLFVSVIYTAHVVQWSVRFGRLAMDPVYDDVGYLIDGLSRLNAFQESGIRGLCQSLVHAPPHSPYSTLVATLAFDLFGVHDWAPYFLNGIPLFIFLALAASLIRTPPGGSKIAIVLTFLMLQLPFQCILQFRPDFPLAVLTAACVGLLLKDGCFSPGTSRKSNRYFGFGLLGGLALLVKPPFFPATLALIFGAFGIAEIYRFVFERKERSIAQAIERSLFFLAGIVVLAGPFFLFSWHEVVEYITTNTGSGAEAAMWKGSGGFWGALTTRLRGYPMYLTFGPLATPFAIWMAIGLAAQALLQRWRSLIFTLSLLFWAALSLLALALIGMTDPNFSFGWELLFALAAVVSVGELATVPYGRIVMILYLATIFFVYYKAGPPRQVWALDPDTTKGQSLNQAILDTITQLAPSAETSKHVFLTFTGSVNTGSQTWLALTEHLPIQIDDFHRAPDPEQIVSRAQKADFIEVADPSSTSLASWVPSNRQQNLFLERMRQDQEFEQIRSFTGKRATIYLFRKKPVSTKEENH